MVVIVGVGTATRSAEMLYRRSRRIEVVMPRWWSLALAEQWMLAVGAVEVAHCRVVIMLLAVCEWYWTC